MAAQRSRITAPQLEQFVVVDVQLTGETLGAGAYGSVEEVEIPGARVAAKKLHTQLINLGSSQQVHKWVTDFVEECKLMSQLRHPHIVQFLGVAYLPGSPIPVLLMEKLQTSLDNLLETSPNIPLDVKVYLLTGTAQGVVYLHSRDPPIAHRDLTARNILINSGLTAKIADLGVARMVNIQPGQLAATMTAGPGNNLYMPPETVQEEGATRYNTAIDIFSFGVVSLFTLTQTFPKDLKPHNYRDPRTRRIVGRSEIERREHYIQPMQAALGETHPLVKLTLDCLEYDPEDRPSAVEVLRRLEEVGGTVPQNCTETKLELTQQIQQKQRQISELQAASQSQISRLQSDNAHLQTNVDRLQADNAHLQAKNQEQQQQIDHLKTENQKQVHGLEELTSLQQPQLEVQHTEMEPLSNQLRSLELQPREKGSGERDVSVASTKKSTMVPSSITFNWRKCKDRPRGMDVYDQPVALNGKLYVRGGSRGTWTVLEYTPGHDQWTALPPPPVDSFTIATLRGRLLVIGGTDKSTYRGTNTILTFHEHSQQWIRSHPAMPTALTFPAVIVYQDHLIVAGGRSSKNNRIPDVDILGTASNKWKTAQPLPNTDNYCTVLIEDTLYLVGQDTQTVLRAHVPTLVSGAKSGVWETLPNAPCYRSSPVTIGNTLLTVGGDDKPQGGNPTASIHMYNPTTNQWTRVGDLPEPMESPSCIIMNSELFSLGSLFTYSLFVSKLSNDHS